jgi:hypothetical protein
MPDVSACPANPPPPAGYSVWKGHVPEPLVAWAKGLRDHIAKYPLHTVWWSDPDIYPDLVAARSDSHTWTYKPGRGLVTGICIRGITLYRPLPDKGLRSATTVVLDPATAQPDPQLAVYDPAAGPNWMIVASAGLALVAVVALFWGAMRGARAAAAARNPATTALVEYRDARGRLRRAYLGAAGIHDLPSPRAAARALGVPEAAIVRVRIAA